ncbi:succinate dehydrogenase assembly factor 2 [Rhodotorula mucilaginosa]|uniref:Succinate dehydrogenase assembly factor 2, mitochondrial n=1 Tax=Rhodotorula mucilaginosa TaxID=5537 RepID=A0A9P6W7X0_RHOMI|nr:succinate dehydrogenase assembly factor 2 [Rhodotorula mucilaginosa]TKA55132.1 hypothetical protein B0A53_02102 [Rhodotorula sp. CCFEE 5036]
MLRSLTSRAPAFARPRLASSLPGRAFAVWTPRSSSSSSSSSSDDRIHPALVEDPPVANPSTETDPWTLKTPPMPEPPKLDPAIKSMDDLINSPHPEGRDREPTETLRKRLVYESRKRGILEMDLILSTFARDRLANMSDRELREYDRFLTLPDWTIYYYVTGKAEAPEPWRSSAVLSDLLHHSANKGKTVRRMPDLDPQQ